MEGRNVWGTKRNRWGAQSSNKSESIQKDTMPSPSAAEIGKVYQYIGETTADFTNGYFYECVLEEGSYVWRQKDVQPEARHPYLSLERLRKYLYRVTFDSIPEDDGGDTPVAGGCSSFVQDGKLHRNFDFRYDNAASFIVRTNDFEGMAMMTGLDDGAMDDGMIAQLPYRMVDGRNNSGIMVSAHVLFNDWEYTGAGSKSIPMTRLPFEVLSRVKSMATISNDLADVLGNLNVTSAMGDYLLQVLVTDGTTTYAIVPPDTDGQSYELVDASAYPKMTNFRYVSRAEVSRHDMDLQDRPTGIERFNAMPCDLEELRFTKCYEDVDRLSEFIGIDGTTKASTDEELTAIYDEARAEYLARQRDGVTWQTMHSVVYDQKMLRLCIQENWKDNCVTNAAWGGIGGDIDDQADLAEALNGKMGKVEITFAVDTPEQMASKSPVSGDTCLVKSTGKIHTYNDAWDAGTLGNLGVLYIAENETYVYDTDRFVVISTDNAMTLNGKSEEHFAAKMDIPSLIPYRTSAAQDIIDAGKQDKPTTQGTAGQVLGLDEDGKPTWITPQGVVRYDEVQNLTEAQKEQARDNIGAVGFSQLNTKVMSLDFGDYEDTISVVNVFGAVKITEVATNGNVASVKLSHGSIVRQTVTPGEVDIDIASGETMIWEITRSTDNKAAALGVKLNIIGG